MLPSFVMGDGGGGKVVFLFLPTSSTSNAVANVKQNFRSNYWTDCAPAAGIDHTFLPLLVPVLFYEGVKKKKSLYTSRV